MTRRKAPLKTLQRTVLTFDICSSSDILEDLLRSENIKKWRDLLIWMKEYLVRKADDFDFDLYKFTGDGWIILFAYDCLGRDLFDFIKSFSKAFDKRMTKLSKDLLESPPDILGLTYGIDRGTLARFEMEEKKEYIGRAINVACRLQSSIKDKDRKPQYKILMTKNLYRQVKKEIRDYKKQNVTRKLHNIAGDKTFNCVKVTLTI